MNIHYTKEQFIDRALKIRNEIEDIAITTDIMVGFPSETESDIEDTLDVIRDVEFDNAFTFIYSKRMGTPAAKREDQVSEENVKMYFDKVLSLVQESAKKRALIWQGKTFDALVEEVNQSTEGFVTGRLSNNMLVHFKGDESLIGNIVPVKLDECRGFYYIGSRV